MLKQSSLYGTNCSRINNLYIHHNCLIIISFAFIFYSCENGSDKIRKEVHNRPIHPILYGLVEMYSQAYYKLPEDYMSLYNFIMQYKKNEPDDFSDLEYYTKHDILRDFSPRKVRYSYYRDSIFILLSNQSGDASCYYIGNPFYRIDHPELYLTEEMDFWEKFKTSAFNNNGEYVFPSQFDYDSLDSCIIDVFKKYKTIVLNKGYYLENGDSILDRHLTEGYYPFRCVISYGVTNDSLAIISNIPPIEHLLLKAATSDTSVLDSSIHVLCYEYLEDIKQVIKAIVKDYPNIDSVMTTIPLYCNNVL